MTQFEECIIHIGTMKTGTTTLQRFFRRNIPTLTKKGILYPKTLGKQTHVLLTALALGNEKKNNQMRILEKNNIKSSNFYNEISNSFEQEIKTGNYKNLLLSSESMSLLLNTTEEIHSLKKFLDKFCSTYKIVVYLRSQHELAISNFSTNCKHQAKEINFFPEAAIKKGFFNYEGLLDNWEKVFGFENIMPRIFSQDELLDGDIKKDFCNIFGWNWEKFEDTKNFNESINADAQRFLLEINKFIPMIVGNKLYRYRGNLAQLVSLNNKGEGLLPTRKDTEEFLELFEKSNERLRKKWFPERKVLFKVDLTKYPEKTNPLTDNEFAFRIFAKVWELKQKELIAAKNENIKLRKAK